MKNDNKSQVVRGPYTFEPGLYYVGDPCYGVPDEDWMPLLKQTDYFKTDSLFEYRGAKCFAYSTMYGDGLYQDKQSREYGVDAGLLSIMPQSCCVGAVGMNLIEYDKKFKVYVRELNTYDFFSDKNYRTFHFGHVKIKT